MAGLDLSSLIKPAEAPTPVANVTDLVLIGSEANIRDVIALSDQVPIVIEFHSTGANSLAQKLEAGVRKRDGKLVLVRIDGQKEAQLAAAFKVERVPVVMALVKGQPVPLFEGDLTAEEVEQYLAKLLEVAATNGLVGTVAVGNEPKLSPVTQKAYDMISAGDLAGAKKVFEAALTENPRDLELIAGLAQVNLMIRTEGLDFTAILGDNTAEFSIKADVLAASGLFEQAFELLLEAFAAAKSDQVKAQLLELFEVAGATEPTVIAARKRLTNLLY